MDLLVAIFLLSTFQMQKCHSVLTVLLLQKKLHHKSNMNTTKPLLQLKKKQCTEAAQITAQLHYLHQNLLTEMLQDHLLICWVTHTSLTGILQPGLI